MGSTHWRHAGLSLILDNSAPDQARAISGGSRPDHAAGYVIFTCYGTGVK